MPFTFAHPAVILPLSKIKIKNHQIFNMTALVIGSMAPDFEYFIHFRPFQEHGHSLLGLFYFNLPLVIIISSIYHNILKKQLITNLPKPFCQNYAYLTQSKWKLDSLKKIGTVIYSSILGMLTHLLWDSFTHKGAYFVEKIEFLTNSLNLLEYSIPIYKILQHGSTLLGLTILAIYLFKIRDKSSGPKAFNPTPLQKILHWSGTVLLSGIIFFVVLFIRKDFALGSLVVTGINSLFIAITTISFFKNKLQGV